MRGLLELELVVDNAGWTFWWVRKLGCISGTMHERIQLNLRHLTRLTRRSICKELNVYQMIFKRSQGTIAGLFIYAERQSKQIPVATPFKYLPAMKVVTSIINQSVTTHNLDSISTSTVVRVDLTRPPTMHDTYEHP